MSENLVELLIALILGGYVYTTGVFLFLIRRVDAFRTNHLQHAERAINEVRRRLGMPAIKLFHGEDEA